ncbi:hypothetical protein EON81_12160 [bacterium]|nr:MAG: hypothetical protein EON81_12160 [bacterium]
MPYIANEEAAERAREYLEEHPALYAGALGAASLAFGTISLFLFRQPTGKYVFSRWGALLLATLFLGLFLWRLGLILWERGTRNH